MILKSWFLGCLVKMFKVNNFATSRSITWPRFAPAFRWGKGGQVIDLEVFTCVLLKLCFFLKISFSLQKEEFFGKTKKQWNKGGQVIDLWWPSYWAYISYIYICTYTWLQFDSVSLFFCRIGAPNSVGILENTVFFQTQFHPISWKLCSRSSRDSRLGLWSWWRQALALFETSSFSTKLYASLSDVRLSLACSRKHQ